MINGKQSENKWERLVRKKNMKEMQNEKNGNERTISRRKKKKGKKDNLNREK